MVTLFKILVLYVIIASKCASIPATEPTTFNFDRNKVKQKMNEFNEILEQIKEPSIKYKLEGKIEEIVQRALEAENKNEMLHEDKGRLMQDKNAIEKDLHRLKIPILVRTIRDRVQEKWPKPSKCEKCLEFGHPTNQCTASQTKKSKDPKEEKLRETVRYWFYLIREHPTDPELNLLVEELHRAYNNTKMFQNLPYDEYQKLFFRYLGIACGITDSMVHVDIVLEKIKQLNVFGCPIDEFMSPLVKALGYLVNPKLPPVIYESSEEATTSGSPDTNHC